MDSSASPRAGYADWKAPAEDGQVLLWPEPTELLRDTESNARRLRAADSVRVQGLPLIHLRRELRRWIGHADEQRPLVAMGHQAELYHPGVWAKDPLIDAVATKLGGSAYHIAIDTDEPKHLQLRWPGGAAPLVEDATDAAWTGLLPPPTPAHVAQVAESLRNAAAGWGFRPLAFDVLESIRRLSPEAENLPQVLTAAFHEHDWKLGLRHHAMLFSPLCRSEPYLTFVCHVLSRADQFAADYNASLEEYRRENRIRTPGRPMPNLKVTDETIEVPFWFDSFTDGSRTRATVHRRRGGWALTLPTGADEFLLQPSAEAAGLSRDLTRWLHVHNLRLAPRALTTTMLIRLLLADQFVHGIGGARYDQVTDKLIASHFGLEPPRFAVTTASLYFPHAAGRARVCIPCVRGEGHRLRHRVLGPEKDRLVAAIAEAPRGSIERSVLFHEMHRRLNAAARHPAILEWERNLEETERHEREEAEVFDRELFYAIQPAERLESLIAHYRGEFAA
jgi:hypothetical protein